MMIMREIGIRDFQTNEPIGEDQWMSIEIDQLLILQKDRLINSTGKLNRNKLFSLLNSFVIQ